jgi:hypothetical protein
LAQPLFILETRDEKRGGNAKQQERSKTIKKVNIQTDGRAQNFKHGGIQEAGASFINSHHSLIGACTPKCFGLYGQKAI